MPRHRRVCADLSPECQNHDLHKIERSARLQLMRISAFLDLEEEFVSLPVTHLRISLAILKRNDDHI